MSVTQNMNITLPVVGTTVGPTWANTINSAFSTVDSHDHSSGKGVQVTPSGININADFPMVSNNITQIRSSRYTAQGSPLALGTDLNCVYVSGVDLYYNDGNGNQVRMTQSGNVAGSAGSISGLSSPASASYALGIFTWQSAANTPAYMDSASVTIREPVANGKGCTLQTVAALGADYSIYLPQLPVSTKILIMDSSGNMTASYVTDNSTLEVSSNTLRIKDSGVTGAKLNSNVVDNSTLQYSSSQLSVKDSGVTPAKLSINYSLSSSSGNYTNAAFPTLSTIISTSITTSGKPVWVYLINDQSGSIADVSNTNTYTYMYLYRDATLVNQWQLLDTGVPGPAPVIGGLICFEVPAASTYTYYLKTISDGMNCKYVKLLVKEA